MSSSSPRTVTLSCDGSEAGLQAAKQSASSAAESQTDAVEICPRIRERSAGRERKSKVTGRFLGGSRCRHTVARRKVHLPPRAAHGKIASPCLYQRGGERSFRWRATITSTPPPRSSSLSLTLTLSPALTLSWSLA